MVKAESETLEPEATKEGHKAYLPGRGSAACTLYFTLLGPEPDQLANDR